MKYKVNEIFLSLQGEGFWTGTPMVFLRLSGCNLRCPFCDTDHAAFTEMTVPEVVSAVRAAARPAGCPAGNAPGCDTVCITGGEPLLQLEKELIDALHVAGFSIHLETNGTLDAPSGIDWITVSPKQDEIKLSHAHELKLLFFGDGRDVEKWYGKYRGASYFLQPCDTGDPARNAAILAQLMDYIRTHPWWRLSLQTHKLLGIR